MPERSFGAELRRLRQHHELRSTDVAQRVGISKQYLSDLEHGRRDPTQMIVDRLIAGLMLVATPAGQDLREVAFLARGECCPRCGFGKEMS